LFDGLDEWRLAFRLVYAGLLASFRGGVHWAHALVTKREGQMLLAMAPSLISLILTCWAVLMISGGLIALIYGKLLLSGVAAVYSLLYFSLLIMDAKWLDPELLPDSYMKTRSGITLIVIASLAASIVFLWI